MPGVASAASAEPSAAPVCELCADLAAAISVQLVTRESWAPATRSAGTVRVYLAERVRCAACGVGGGWSGSAPSAGAGGSRGASAAGGGAGPGVARATPLRRPKVALAASDAALLAELRRRVAIGACALCAACPCGCCHAYDIGAYLGAMEAEIARRAVVRQGARLRRSGKLGGSGGGRGTNGGGGGGGGGGGAATEGDDARAAAAPLCVDALAPAG